VSSNSVFQMWTNNKHLEKLQVTLTYVANYQETPFTPEVPVSRFFKCERRFPTYVLTKVMDGQQVFATLCCNWCYRYILVSSVTPSD